MPLYPNEMVPLQIDLARGVGRYLFGRLPNPPCPTPGDRRYAGEAPGASPRSPHVNHCAVPNDIAVSVNPEARVARSSQLATLRHRHSPTLGRDVALVIETLDQALSSRLSAGATWR